MTKALFSMGGSSGLGWSDFLEICQTCDELGFWGFYPSDHLMQVGAGRGPTPKRLEGLTVMAAILKEKGLAEKVGWQKSFFLDGQKMQIEAGEIPKAVRSMCNYKMANRRMVIGLVGGGVTINPRQTVRQMKFQPSADNRLNQLQKNIAIEKPPAAHAWWRN